MVSFVQAQNGYWVGQLTGNMDCLRYEIELTSGKLIYLYEDEFIR